MSSPIAAQAAEIITKFVDQLHLHRAFGLPDKIKEHAKSEPIVADKIAEVSSDESETDEEGNSIVKKGKGTIGRYQRPPRASFPEKTVMQELREKLVRRKMGPHTQKLRGKFENTTPIKIERRKKLTSQVLKETETAIEVIPRLVSTDTGSARSVDSNWGADNCGTMLVWCGGEETEVPKPLRIEWQHGDFLTVDEALKLASTQGPRFAAGGSDEKDLSFAVSSDSDDGSSMSYSMASDDGSMVPLRHGERETTNSAPPIIQTEARSSKPAPPSPEEFTRLHRISPAKRQPAEPTCALNLALSLSGDSENLIPGPPGPTASTRSKVATSTQELPMPNKASTPKNPTPAHLVPTSDGSHKQELLAKIEEFQRKRETRVSTMGEQSPRSTRKTAFRQSVELPKASKKIAQVYVDALYKKFEQVDKEPKSTMRLQAVVGPGIRSVATDVSDDGIPVPGMWKNRAAVCTTNYNPNVSNILCHGGAGDTTVSGDAAIGFGTNVDDLVSRMENVVQGLIQSGKIDLQAALTAASSPRQQILRSNTEELLHNLAILRARRGGSRGESPAPSATNRSVQTTHTDAAVVTPGNAVGIPIHLTANQKSHVVQREESKSIQMLRAKRDQAAVAVRNSAKRLSGWSSDYSSQPTTTSEEHTLNTLQERPHQSNMGRSFSSARLAGPPRPECYTKVQPGAANMTPPRVVQHLNKPPTQPRITRLEHEDRLGPPVQRASSSSPMLMLSSSDPAACLRSWEQEQLKELPVLLQATFSGNNHGQGISDDDDDEETEDPYHHMGATYGTDEETDGETTDYGSDDDTARLDRIEHMIQELRARKMRL